MPNIDLNILNQRQTPAFYADTFANRPPAGFVGRIFVSTNTFEFFRDNGTTYDLIGGPGTSTITGSGANGQVSFWNGASTITGSNDLFYDAVNGHLGIGTITPGTALGIDHDQSTVIQLQQTVATNDNRIAFINNGVGLWRIGAFYNAGANDFGIFDVVGSAQPVTVKKTTGQVLIGTSTVGSGKLVVASATGDNGVQIVGATAPSLRIDNAASGPTKRAGFGIATATNNFIQGSADRDFCMFNGSTTASPILFGVYDAGLTNIQEAARISPARNFIIGNLVDNGSRLQCDGSSTFSGSITANGAGNSIRSGNELRFFRTDNAIFTQLFDGGGANGFVIDNRNGDGLSFCSVGTTQVKISNTGNLLISTLIDTGDKLNVNGTCNFFGATNGVIGNFRGITGRYGQIYSDANAAAFGASTSNAFGTNYMYINPSLNIMAFITNGNQRMSISAAGIINMSNVPSSAAGLVSGDIYKLGSVLNIVP